MHTSPVGLSFRLPLLFVSLIFSREVKGEREGKQRKGVGSARRIGEGGRLEGREGRNEGRREGGGILMVADYAADFTRLGFSVPFSASTLCARQAKKPLYSAAKDGGGGEGVCDCEAGWVMIPANRHVRAWSGASNGISISI